MPRPRASQCNAVYWVGEIGVLFGGANNSRGSLREPGVCLLRGIAVKLKAPSMPRPKASQCNAVYRVGEIGVLFGGANNDYE
ncbi:MAG: hypothetical protein JNM43_22995 [Planctomycetaceae bacterium]|nr:hypothetical protein [Planctomycetaceae bacterium]